MTGASIGSLIKLKRLKNNMTQGHLSAGICTTSYLSRIENNQVIAEETIYKLLFDKLGIEYKSNYEFDIKIDAEIENWYLNMLERKKATHNINQLRKSAKATDNGASIKFDLVYCRHLMMSGNLDQAGKILHYIGKVLKKNRSRSLFIYTNILMIYYNLKKEYTKSLELGLALFEVEDYKDLAKSRYEIALFYYSIGLNYSSISEYTKCSHFIHKALDIFNNNYNFDRALDCQLLLGVAYNNLKDWEQSINASHLSEKILKSFTIASEDNYYGKIYNNLGYCFERQSKYTESVKYYEMSLEYKKEPNDRLRTLINLIRCNHARGNIEKATRWLQSGLSLKDRGIQQKYILQLDIYTMLLQDTDIAIKDVVKLQTTSIKYFSENNMNSFVSDYTHLFASLYEKYNHYKKANNMYKLHLKTIKKIEAKQY